MPTRTKKLATASEARVSPPHRGPLALDRALLATLSSIAHRAGVAIMSFYDAKGDTPRHEVKTDGSPVTQADRQAEDIIATALARLAPDIPLVAEERFAAGHIPDIASRPFWLVDPLDGTKEFLSRNGEFTVNIALIDGGQPVAGVVHAPARNVTYFGALGLGAFRQDANQKDRGSAVAVPIRARRDPKDSQTPKDGHDPEDGLCVVASRSHGGGAEMDAFLEPLNVAQFTSAGSSLKFCLVACGIADVYPRFGRTMEWDTAAGQAVLEAAGGHVVVAETLDTMTYGKSGFANPHFVAWGNRSNTHDPCQQRGAQHPAHAHCR